MNAPEAIAATGEDRFEGREAVTLAASAAPTNALRTGDGLRRVPAGGAFAATFEIAVHADAARAR